MSTRRSSVLLVAILLVLAAVVALLPGSEPSKTAKPEPSVEPKAKSVPQAFAPGFDFSMGDGAFGSNMWGLPWAVDRNVDPIIGVGTISESNGQNTAIGVRFAAVHSGQLSTMKTYWLSNTGSPYGGASGYAAGTGGVIRIRLYEATLAGAPDGLPLDTIIFTPGLVGGCLVSAACPTAITPSYQAQQSSAFTWPNTPSLTRGGRYIITWENIDPNPAANWIRLQFGTLGESATDNPAGFSFMNNPGWDRSRFGFSYRQGASGAWTDGATYDSATGSIYDVVPMIGFRMVDGKSFGNSSWYRNTDHANYNYCGYGGTGTTLTHCTYTAGHPLGERFRPDVNLNVAKLHTALSPRDGGTIALQLRRASDLAILGTCNISTPTLDQTPSNQYHGYIRSRQYSCALPSTVALTAGTQYDFWIAPSGTARGSVLTDGDLTNWPFAGGGPMQDMLGATIDGTYFDGGSIAYYDVMFGLELTSSTGSVTTTTSVGVPALDPEPVCAGGITVHAETASSINGSVPIVGGYRVFGTVNTSVGETVTLPSSGTWTLQTRYHATAAATRTLYLAPGTGGAGFSAINQSYPATSGTWQTKSEVLTLVGGSQTFSLSYEASDVGLINVDYFRLCPTLPPALGTVTVTPFPACVSAASFTWEAITSIPATSVSLTVSGAGGLFTPALTGGPTVWTIFSGIPDGTWTVTATAVFSGGSVTSSAVTLVKAASCPGTTTTSTTTSTTTTTIPTTTTTTTTSTTTTSTTTTTIPTTTTATTTTVLAATSLQVVITSPVNLQTNVSQSSTIQVSATTASTCTITTVRIFVDGILRTTDNAAPYASSTLSASPVIRQGTHTASAQATDSCGRTKVSKSVIFTIPLSTPTTIRRTGPTTSRKPNCGSSC